MVARRAIQQTRIMMVPYFVTFQIQGWPAEPTGNGARRSANAIIALMQSGIDRIAVGARLLPERYRESLVSFPRGFHSCRNILVIRDVRRRPVFHQPFQQCRVELLLDAVVKSRSAPGILVVHIGPI